MMKKIPQNCHSTIVLTLEPSSISSSESFSSEQWLSLWTFWSFSSYCFVLRESYVPSVLLVRTRVPFGAPE